MLSYSKYYKSLIKKDTLSGNCLCPKKMKIPCCSLCSRRSGTYVLTKIETVGLWIVEDFGAVCDQPK